MKRFIRAVLSAAALIAAGLWIYSNYESHKPGFSYVSESNQAMNQAIERARETLPVFWKAIHMPVPGQSDFALKVEITDGKKGEHFWLTRINSSGGKITGTVQNEPVNVETVKFGQRYVIPEKDISDWMYVQDGKIYGGFTIRVLVDLQKSPESEKLRATLAYEPK